MKIIVATDGSRGGMAAVRFGARLASRDPGAQLVLLTIDTRAVRGPAHPAPDDVLSKATQEVRDLGISDRCRSLALHSRREVPEAISALADRLRADLIVIGSEGRDTLAEWVVGGVALRLIYVARRPVVVVRPERRARVSRRPEARLRSRRATA